MAAMENSDPKADQIEVEMSEFENDFNVISYTKFYDEFLEVDLLQESWPKVESSISKRLWHVMHNLDVVEGKRKVSRATKHEDPDIILRGMDVLELLSRSVPAEWALLALDCSFQYEIIEIGNQDEGICNVYGGITKGNTVAVIGSLQGINMIGKFVEDCIAHGVPLAPRVRMIRKKTQPKKDARVKMTSEVMRSLEALRV
ncbi:KRR1 small subunit processome component-like [Argentina anserina]|uniref:KRR1 small subunit processome component-like n=1 Tax=Argentina anserina TaxID=57926 RepID=UPI0021764F2A|nr:KRR1 small subunit processome component-like [Potentilla anserina]